MDKQGEQINTEIINKKGTIHYILSGDYIIFLIAFILGVLFDLIFPHTFFRNIHLESVGLLFITLGPILILWAQSTSRKLAKNPSQEQWFSSGPYKYTRNPTHSGVFLMMFGFGLVTHSFFTLIFIIIADIVSKLTILRRQDKILEGKYGEAFVDYKKKVRDWL